MKSVQTLLKAYAVADEERRLAMFLTYRDCGPNLRPLMLPNGVRQRPQPVRERLG